MLKKLGELTRTAFTGHSSDKDKNNSMQKKYTLKSLIGMEAKQTEDFDKIQKEEYIKLCKIDRAIKIKNAQKRRQSSQFSTSKSVSDHTKTRTSSFQGSNSYVQLFSQQKRKTLCEQQINILNQNNPIITKKSNVHDFPFSRAQTKQSYTQHFEN